MSKKTKKKDLVGLLDSLVEDHHLLKHPFYRAWSEGSLSREALQLYAEQYYQHVRAFPENLRELVGRTNGDLAQMVQENLDEELHPGGAHPVLWRQFANSLGVSDATLDESRPLPGIAALLDTFDELSAQATPLHAVAAFYAYESQVPEISTQKIAGLRRFYDVNDASALAYFVVHEEADIRHRAAWREWLSAQSEDGMFGAMCAAERTLKALWGALDSVYPQVAAAKN